MHWENNDFRVEIDEVVGIESSLDLGTSASITRRFQVRQVPRSEIFEPIPYPLASMVFREYVLRYERFYDGLPFKQIRFIEDKEKIGEIFDAEVVYAMEWQKNTEGDKEYTLPTFSLMGGKKTQMLPANVSNPVTRHILHKKNESSQDALKRIVEYKMIGWDGKKFNGIEIEVPDPKFMIPAWYPAAAITVSEFEFIGRLMKFVGTVNSEPFYGLLPCECKYLGPEQSWVTRTIETGNPEKPVELIRVIELQHQFQVQLEKENVKVGDLTIDKIPGWAYVDIHYENAMEDIGDGKKIPLAKASQVDVVKVYEEKDFWELFDGTILKDLWEGALL